MTATQPHFQLMRRRLGSHEYAYELHRESAVLVRGSAKGRMLRKPARFSSTQGAFVIRPASKLATRWTVTLDSGRVFAHLDLGTSSDGAVRVDTNEGSYRFVPIEPAWRHELGSTMTIDSDTFQLLAPSGRPLAVTGLPTRTDSIRDLTRAVAATVLPALGRSLPTEGLTLMASGWEPAPEFVTALLVFKALVPDHSRAAA